MKLSNEDRENIEVLEALDLDENALFILLCRYFAYRNKRMDGRLGFSPNQTLQETIHGVMTSMSTPTGREQAAFKRHYYYGAQTAKIVKAKIPENMSVTLSPVVMNPGIQCRGL